MIRTTSTHLSEPTELLQPDSMTADAAHIADFIRARTFGRVRNLTVKATPGVVRLSGHVGSFYLKQLAQHAALEAMRGETLYNAIEVEASGQNGNARVDRA